MIAYLRVVRYIIEDNTGFRMEILEITSKVHGFVASAAQGSITFDARSCVHFRHYRRGDSNMFFGCDTATRPSFFFSIFEVMGI